MYYPTFNRASAFHERLMHSIAQGQKLGQDYTSNNEPSESSQYYFCFDIVYSMTRQQMVMYCVFFSQDGEIMFSRTLALYVSEWLWNRLGKAKQADRIKRYLCSLSFREGIPLVERAPFEEVEDGIFLANVDWQSYNISKSICSRF